MINYLPPKFLSFPEQLRKLFPEKNLVIKELTFQVTEDCCLKCSYCYQINKTKQKMSFDIAKTFLDNLFQDKYPELLGSHGFVLDFIGGEPLLEIDLIQQICDYYFEQCLLHRRQWLLYSRISICSNGILYFEPKVQTFFQKYKNYLSFTISIDGNKFLHDSCRKDFNNQGSYDRAIAAVRHFREHYPHNRIDTKMTLAPNNINYLYDAITNLINEGYVNIPCNCIFEPGWTLEHAKILYQQLKQLADYFINNNLYNKIRFRMFDENNFRPIDPTENRNWCGGTAGTMVTIDYQGNLYRCIRFMTSSLGDSQPPYIIGNIYDGFGSTKLERQRIETCDAVTRQSQSTEECFNCSVAQGCAWCSGYNYQETGSVNKRVTHICTMHKATALANVYYWNSLYKYLNLEKKFHNYLSKEDSIMIIGEKEYQQLQLLERV